MHDARDREQAQQPHVHDASPASSSAVAGRYAGIEDLQSRAGNRAVVVALRESGALATSARRLVVRRDLVDDWDAVYKTLSPEAKTGYDQFVQLNGTSAAERVSSGAKQKDSGKYDTARADTMWSKKKMDDKKFGEELTKKQEKDSKDVKEALARMNHICNETDGTNRPGSVGDGTSDWALYWEAEHGEPFRSPAGHAYKLRDYCKVLSEGLAEVAAKKSSIPADDKMGWSGKKGDPAVQVETAAQITAVVNRATERLAKMRLAVKAWNARIGTYPDKWKDDGTSKVPPPGLDPLAKGQLTAGWPKDKEVKEY